MKKIIEFLFGKKEHPIKKHKNHTSCDFGIKEFNKTKRSKVFVEELNLSSKGKGGGKPPKNPHENPPPPPPPTPSTGVIFLCFEGATVVNRTWNILAPTITCAYSGLSEDEKQEVIVSVVEDYSIFDVIVTTDENIYNATPVGRRVKCIFTESYEWYGNGAGGVAQIDSFFDGSDDPCFVFTSLWGYVIKKIKETASHETGHTVGLFHQAKYDVNCSLISEYNSGTVEEAPIMGRSVNSNIGKWWVGPTPYGCNEIQDDVQKISQILALK